MDEPGRVSDAGVGEGARRVQPDRARLQSQACPQHRGAPKADRRAPGLKATALASPIKSKTLSTIQALDSSFANLILGSKSSITHQHHEAIEVARAAENSVSTRSAKISGTRKKSANRREGLLARFW